MTDDTTRAELVLDVCAKLRNGEVTPVVARVALITAGVPKALIIEAIGEVSPEAKPAMPKATDGPAETRDAERLPNVEQRPSVSREPAAALFTTADAPVLPPGCELRLGPNGAQVWTTRGTKRGMMLVAGSDARVAAERAWDAFGAFLGRREYETLVEAAGATERARATIGRAAHEALDAAGIERVSNHEALTLPERIGLLASRVGDAQAGAAHSREALEQEILRLRECVDTAHRQAASDVARLAAERDAAVKATAAAERRTEAHRTETSRLTDTIQRLRGEVADAERRALLLRDERATLRGELADAQQVRGQFQSFTIAGRRVGVVDLGPAGEDPDHD